MQKNMNTMFDETNKDLIKEQELHKKEARQTALQLVKLKQQNTLKNSNDSESSNENWEIEYDDED